MLTNRRNFTALLLLAMLVFGFSTLCMTDPNETDADSLTEIYYEDGTDTGYALDSENRVVKGSVVQGPYLGNDGFLYYEDGTKSDEYILNNVVHKIASYGSSLESPNTHDVITVSNPFDITKGSESYGALTSIDYVEVVTSKTDSEIHLSELYWDGKTIYWGAWFSGIITEKTVYLMIHSHWTGIFLTDDYYEKYGFKVSPKQPIGTSDYPRSNIDRMTVEEIAGASIYLSTTSHIEVVGNTNGTNIDYQITSIDNNQNVGLTISNTSTKGYDGSTHLKTISGDINVNGTMRFEINWQIKFVPIIKTGETASTQTVTGTTIVFIIKPTSEVADITFKDENGNVIKNSFRSSTINSPDKNVYQVQGGHSIHLPTNLTVTTNDSKYLYKWKDSLGGYHDPGEELGVVKDNLTFTAVTTNYPTGSNYMKIKDTIVIEPTDSLSFSYPSTSWGRILTYSTTPKTTINYDWLTLSANTVVAKNWSVSKVGIPDPGVYLVDIGISGADNTGDTVYHDYFLIIVKSPIDIEYTVSFYSTQSTTGTIGVEKIPGETCVLLYNDTDLPSSYSVSDKHLTGWYIGSNTNITYAIGSYYTPNNASHSFHPQWSSNQYVVVFDANGGSSGGSTKPYAELTSSSDTITLSDRSFTKIGYSFMGWYLDSDEDTIYVTDYMYTPSGVNGEVKYFRAYWVPENSTTIKVTFNKNNSSATVTHPTEQYVESGKYVALPMKGFNLSSYELSGWSTNSTNAATNFAEKGHRSAIAITAETTFYACWSGNTIRVFFYADHGQVSETYRDYTVGSTYGSFPTVKNLDQGYSWNSSSGWTTVSGKSSTMVSPNTYVTSSITKLYAYFQADSYKIYLDPDSSTGATVTPYINVRYGEQYSLPTPDYDTNTYAFLYWVNKNTNNKFSSSGIYSETASVYLLAKYSNIPIKITLDSDGGTIEGDVTYITRGYGAEYGELPTVTKEGYSFGGWYNSKGVVTSTTIFDTDSGRTLTAHWTKDEESYSVLLNAYGGQFEGNETTKQINGIVPNGVWPELSTPTRDNFRFLGWYTQSINGTLVREGDAIGTINSTRYVVDTTRQITLYAHWETVGGGSETSASYTVDFIVHYARNMSIPSQIANESNGYKITEPATPISTQGKAFNGWTYNGGTFDFSNPITRNMTLESQWKNFASVTYTGNDIVKLTIQSAYVGNVTINWGDGETDSDISTSSCDHKYTTTKDTATITVAAYLRSDDKTYVADIIWDVKNHSMNTNLKADFTYSYDDGKLVLDGSKSTPSQSITTYNWYVSDQYVGHGKQYSGLNAPTKTVTVYLEIIDVNGNRAKSDTVTIDPLNYDDNNGNGGLSVSIPIMIAAGLAGVIGVTFIYRRLSL